MKIRFNKGFYKNWFVFPVCIEWENNLIEYIPFAKGFSVHFLWWHFRWVFMKGGAE